MRDQQSVGSGSCGNTHQGVPTGEALEPAFGEHAVALDGLQAPGDGLLVAVGYPHGPIAAFALGGKDLLVAVQRLAQGIQEKPVQVHAQTGLEGGLGLLGAGMAERPFPVVVLEGGIQAFRADLGLQQGEEVGGKGIGAEKVLYLGTEPCHALSGDGDHALVGGIGGKDGVLVQAGYEALAVRMIGMFVAMFVVAVQALVHPGVASLVGGQHAVEPVVSHFVRDDHVQALAPGTLVDESEHGVFHPSGEALDALHGAGLRPGVGAHQTVVEMNGAGDVADGGLPAFRLVGRVGHLPDRAALATELDDRVLEQEGIGSGPGKIGHPEGFHQPGTLAGAVGCQAAAAGSASLQGLLAVRGGGGVGRHAGGNQGEAVGQGDPYAVVGEVLVELTHLQVGRDDEFALFAPGHLGEPVGELPDASVGAHAGMESGQCHGEAGLDTGRAAGSQGTGKGYAKHVGSFGGKVQQGVLALMEGNAGIPYPVFGLPEVFLHIPEAKFLSVEGRSGFGEGVRPGVEHEMVEGVLTGMGVIQHYGAFEGLRGGVQPGLDAVTLVGLAIGDLGEQLQAGHREQRKEQDA